jgi:hypothetical protein
MGGIAITLIVAAAIVAAVNSGDRGFHIRRGRGTLEIRSRAMAAAMRKPDWQIFLFRSDP